MPPSLPSTTESHTSIRSRFSRISIIGIKKRKPSTSTSRLRRRDLPSLLSRDVSRSSLLRKQRERESRKRKLQRRQQQKLSKVAAMMIIKVIAIREMMTIRSMTLLNFQILQLLLAVAVAATMEKARVKLIQLSPNSRLR